MNPDDAPVQLFDVNGPIFVGRTWLCSLLMGISSAVPAIGSQ
jgi:hypothetical protein